jgi:hypothetical protein
VADAARWLSGRLLLRHLPGCEWPRPVREAEINIVTVKRLLKLSEKLNNNPALEEAISRQDAVASQQIVNDIMLAQ